MKLLYVDLQHSIYTCVNLCSMWSGPIGQITPGSQSLLNAPWVHLHLYFHVTKHYPIAILSPKGHICARCKWGFTCNNTQRQHQSVESKVSIHPKIASFNVAVKLNPKVSLFDISKLCPELWCIGGWKVKEALRSSYTVIHMGRYVCT